jgi:hypothetical protein
LHNPHSLGRYLAFHKINMVLIGFDPYAPVFPRKGQKAKTKEDEVKKLESGAQGTAQGGVDELLAPCPVYLSCPIW